MVPGHVCAWRRSAEPRWGGRTASKEDEGSCFGSCVCGCLSAVCTVTARCLTEIKHLAGNSLYNCSTCTDPQYIYSSMRCGPDPLCVLCTGSTRSCCSWSTCLQTSSTRRTESVYCVLCTVYCVQSYWICVGTHALGILCSGCGEARISCHAVTSLRILRRICWRLDRTVFVGTGSGYFRPLFSGVE
jgi:hypothetical protein